MPVGFVVIGEFRASRKDFAWSSRRCENGSATATATAAIYMSVLVCHGYGHGGCVIVVVVECTLGYKYSRGAISNSNKQNEATKEHETKNDETIDRYIDGSRGTVAPRVASRHVC